MKKQFDSWEKKQEDGKYLFGAKAECQFSVKILNKLLTVLNVSSILTTHFVQVFGDFT